MINNEYTLISGAAGVLGKEFCIRLAQQNNNLILTSRSEEKLNKLALEIKQLCPNIEVLNFACDATNQEERNLLFQKIEAKKLKISRLINVAGVDTQKAFVKYTQEKLVFQTRVIFEATASFTLFALKNTSTKLEILTISSLCGRVAMPYFAVYSALKGALNNFFDALRFEFRHNKNITITTILPGSIPTREDIILDIKKQGLTGKLSSKSTSYVVKKSLLALSKRKKNCVIGGYNKLVNFIQTITPKFIKFRIIEKKFSIKEKDAY